MKVAVISDIHLDYNEGHDVIGSIAKIVKENRAEALLIAGDITQDVCLTISAVNEIEQLCSIPVYYVPGNHDMWRSDNSKYSSTEAIYEKFVSDSHCISGKSVVLGTHRLIGDIAWFDYSFGDSCFNKSDFDTMEHIGRTWQDKLFNDWSSQNIATSNRFILEIENTMKKYPNDRFCVMTHMLPIKEFTVPTTIEMWKYFNAFLGTNKLGELYKKYNVDYSICGHVHYRQTIVKDSINYLCRCLNYQSEWREQEGLTCYEQVNDSFDFIEL